MPWNDNKGGNNGGPWGGGGSGGNGNSPWGQQPPSGNQGPDLEDQIKRVQDRFRGRFGGDGGSRNGRGGGFGPLGFGVIALVAGLAWLSTGSFR